MRQEICRRLTLGDSLVTICTDRLMPAYDTVCRWRRDEPDFDLALQQALRDRSDILFEEVIQIADDARNDWMEKNDPDNPGWVANGEHIQRSKIRVEARKWAAAKLNPHKYGDKLALEGNPDKPMVVSVTHRIVRVEQAEELAPPVIIDAHTSDWDDEDEP